LGSNDWFSRKGADIHHIIPESIYEEFPELARYFHVNDAIQNGIPLPNNWHWKHPAYTKWVKAGLEKLKASSAGINSSTIGELRSAAMHYLEQGVNSQSATINQFWKNAEHILPF
jgi:hypothetical protein